MNKYVVYTDAMNLDQCECCTGPLFSGKCIICNLSMFVSEEYLQDFLDKYFNLDNPFLP